VASQTRAVGERPAKLVGVELPKKAEKASGQDGPGQEGCRQESHQEVADCRNPFGVHGTKAEGVEFPTVALVRYDAKSGNMSSSLFNVAASSASTNLTFSASPRSSNSVMARRPATAW
jgi:hypothetical protein